MITQTDAKEVILHYLWHKLEIPRHEVTDDYLLDIRALMAIGVEISAATGASLKFKRPVTCGELVNMLAERGRQPIYLSWLEGRREPTTRGR